MNTLESRLTSFDSVSASTEDKLFLAKCGYYYKNDIGKVRCNECSYTMNDIKVGFSKEHNILCEVASKHKIMSKIIDDNKALRKKIFCLNCNINKSNVLTLPCRHKVICKECEAIHDYQECIVCYQTILGTVEVFL